MNLNSTVSPLALEVRDLVKQYGDFTAVGHLSLKVMRGEVFGFLGPNGAGKTTSIRMMCGLLRPTAGEVLVEGKSLGSKRGPELRARVGICLFLLMFFTGAAFPVTGGRLFSVGDMDFMLNHILSPTWAIQALNKVLVTGLGVRETILEMAAILVLTIFYGLLGTWVFKRRHMRPN